MTNVYIVVSQAVVDQTSQTKVDREVEISMMMVTMTCIVK
jgi:hypothetical protein